MASEPRRFVQGVPLGKPPPHVGPQPRARRDSANGWARSSRCKGGRARQAATIALALACVLVARRVVGGSFAAGEGIVASSSSAATRVAARASASERREALLRSREARGGAGDGATSDRGVDDNETAALPPLIKRACDCPECPSSSPSISSEKPSCDARVRDVEARANAWLSEVKARAERLTTLAKTDACAACGVPSHLAATESESSSSSGAGGGSARGGDADADAPLPLPDLLATTRASAPSPPAPGTRRQKEVLGVCVPYRDRRDQLEVFSAYMKQHLDAQGVPFKIYVAEQSNQSAFNRGWALNAAFMNAERDGVAYVVMHDVDMLPLSGVNYRYDDALRRGGDVAHLSTEASQFAHRGYLPYPKYCSGAFMSTTAFYRAINGHSAKFWGWGGEDDEFCARVAKYKHGGWKAAEAAEGGLDRMFGRPPPGGGRFLSMGGHDQSRDNPRWHANNNVLQRFLASSARVNALDGLSSSGSAEEILTGTEETPLFTIYSTAFPASMTPPTWKPPPPPPKPPPKPKPTGRGGDLGVGVSRESATAVRGS